MGYIFAWDKDFAVENLLPLLDWQRDAIVAQQTWSVLLNYRQGTSVELEQQMLPYYRQFAERMTAMLKGTFFKRNIRNCIANLNRQFPAHLNFGILRNCYICEDGKSKSGLCLWKPCYVVAFGL